MMMMMMMMMLSTCQSCGLVDDTGRGQSVVHGRGDESVPKIIIIDTTNNCFLKLQSAFW